MSILVGIVVGFVCGGNVFYVVIVVGGIWICVINGGLLGVGWMNLVDFVWVL